MNQFKSLIDEISENIKEVSLVNTFDNCKVMFFNLKHISFMFQEENSNKYNLIIKLPKGDIKFSTEQYDVSSKDFIQLKQTLLSEFK